jgi:FkbM family methyltransferase
MDNFATNFIKLFCRTIPNYEKNNWDSVRFAANPEQEHQFNWISSSETLTSIIENSDKFNYARSLFEDEFSRTLYIQLLLFRALGHTHVRLPTNTPDYWAKLAQTDQWIIERDAVIKNGFTLNRYRIPEMSIDCIAHPFNILNSFVIKQYYFNRNSISIQPEEGDIVIDGGACYGDTALAFSHSVGRSGKVLAFDFVKDNLIHAQSNFFTNPILASGIRLIRKALHDKSNEILFFNDTGPGTSVVGKTHGFEIESITIDDILTIEKLPAIDFVKLDIEGSECAALKGAQNTLQQHAPKLAISLYHRLNDFFEIPIMLKTINPQYRMYIDHYTIHAEETVLYAHIPEQQ